jgi:hypothetical protein
VLKKEITYEDYVGATVTETFYFNLSKAELVELELSHTGGLSASLTRIVASEDGAEIIKEFKNIILKAYGVRSEDGRRFIKNDRLREEFVSTEAYSVLFMELVTDAEKAAEFVNGIMPTGLTEDARTTALELVPETKVEPIKLTQDQITTMDAADLQSGLATGRYVL